MSVEFAELEPILRDLFAAQRYAVLGTQGETRVSLNLMALAAADDLRSLILATERGTPKYSNLRQDPRVSLLVDSRSNQSTDTQMALALTVDGLAEEVSGAEREQLAGCLLARHPQLESFVQSPTCALFRIKVEKYIVVTRFQKVREIQIPA